MPNAASGSSELISIAEVAELCGVKPMTAYRWMWSGALPNPIRLGNGKHKTIRFYKHEIEAWLANSRDGHQS